MRPKNWKFWWTKGTAGSDQSTVKPHDHSHHTQTQSAQEKSQSTAAQVNAVEKSREARAQLLAAKARHDKLLAARRTVEALQAALQAGQAQVHRHSCASSSNCWLEWGIHMTILA